jgi:hypothetical protein
MYAASFFRIQACLSQRHHRTDQGDFFSPAAFFEVVPTTTNEGASGMVFAENLMTWQSRIL